MRLFLVLDDLAVELVDQRIDGGVEIFRDRVGEQFRTARVYRGFRFLDQFLDGQYDVHVGDVVVMAFQPVELARDVIAQRVSDIDVMPGDAQLHGRSPRDLTREGRKRTGGRA